MSQKARPVLYLPTQQDVLTGGWTPTPLWPNLDEPVADDTDRVVSSNDPVGDAFEVKLAPLAWPNAWPGGPHRLTVRLKKTGPCPANATIALLQGSTVIASGQVEAATSYQNMVLSLSEAQVASISDFTDLRLRVTASASCSSSSSSSSSGASVPCCPGALPATLSATLTGTGDCEPYSGSYTLTWNGGAWAFVSGPEFSVTLNCMGSDCMGFQLNVVCENSFIYGGQASACSCEPLSLTFPSAAVPPEATCCTGSIGAVVTI